MPASSCPSPRENVTRQEKQLTAVCRVLIWLTLPLGRLLFFPFFYACIGEFVLRANK